MIWHDLLVTPNTKQNLLYLQPLITDCMCCEQLNSLFPPLLLDRFIWTRFEDKTMQNFMRKSKNKYKKKRKEVILCSNIYLSCFLSQHPSHIISHPPQQTINEWTVQWSKTFSLNNVSIVFDHNRNIIQASRHFVWICKCVVKKLSCVSCCSKSRCQSEFNIFTAVAQKERKCIRWFFL